MITGEMIIGLSIAIAAPATMAVFKLLPSIEKKPVDERRHSPINHDHNGTYVRTKECQLRHENAEDKWDALNEKLDRIEGYYVSLDKLIRSKIQLT
jgi:hypothetical protein